VILDAPPVLSMADARILGTKADGVVLVVRAGRTGSNLVLRAGALLESSGAHVLGMVLNGWEPGRSEMSYYRYYQPDVQSDAKSA
jgi:Mrp family chromosome partitioning ATPase